ncbi:MAG: hypothetical protein QOE35_3633 [Actinomycetota bacterium]|jgi:hypothetical protein
MRSRLVVVVLGLVVTAAVSVGVAVNANAQTDSGGFGSFSLVATAPGFEATEDEPSANAHPEGHGAMPETSTLLANGFGYGLAAMVWPGATAANGGALLGLLVPSKVPNTDVPVPDAIGQTVSPVAPAANYPVKAEARSGTAPDASYTQFPGVTMVAHADDAHVTGEASVQRAEQSGMASYGNVRSSSESALSGSVGRATATSSADDVDLGGVIKIKSVTSTATAQTDGKTSSGAGGTVVQGMTIADQKAYVDDQGVHIGEQGQPANAVANQVAAQALTGAGMQIYVSQPRLEQNGGTATYDAGSLFVFWKPPNNDSGNVFTMTFGGARVAVTAGEGFGATVAGESVDTVDSSGDLVPAPDLAVADLPVDAPTALGATAPSAAPTIGTPTPAGFSLARTFGGFAWGWLVLALALVALAGSASRKLLGDLLDGPAADCPLERDR